MGLVAGISILNTYMNIEVLTSKNPWWKGKEYFEEDEDYKRWKLKKIKWVPELIEKIELNSQNL